VNDALPRQDREAEAINDADGNIGIPASADLRRLLEYWNEKRAGRRWPRRRDLDPVDLRFMLERIALTEVHDNPRRYRLRLVGSWWHRLLGFESTGMWMDDWPHEQQRQITVDFYEALVAGGRPRFRRRDAIVDDRLLQYEIMLLPLSDDGGDLSMILTGIGTD
jgi:hypothetical protein